MKNVGKKVNKNKTHRNRKIRTRQWGTENRLDPLSKFHEKPSTSKIVFSRLAIVLTIVFWVIYIASVALRQVYVSGRNYDFTLEAFGYILVVTFLTFSALMYLIARQGALQRFSKHLRVPRALIDQFFSKKSPSITVLVPSYNEEPQVVRKTLLSAALQEYPSLRVVLLLDDPPNPPDPNNRLRLKETRDLTTNIQKLLSTPYMRFCRVLAHYEKKTAKSNSRSSIKALINHYRWAADWLTRQADQELNDDHVDVFFTEQVLRGLAQDLNLVAEALEHTTNQKVYPSRTRVHQLYRRLVWIFGAQLEVFERKQFASLPHDANKAMNLNAYIGLMGGIYRSENTPNGTVLTPVKNGTQSDIKIPDSDFILTLDADSILLREYCLRLVYFLQQPDNAKVAVTQTPYSSFRGAPSRIERLSGATTDIQHILHQGMTQYGATFWVGANALLRKAALDDIVNKEWRGGFEVKRYIQDHTVIEDTESSIDLTLHGWQLVNYPERLSYSATPPDFGSLIIQRRRWANGGLLILPKLLTYVHEAKIQGRPISKIEFMLRLNYMASIAWSSFGLVFLLAYPYDGRLLSPWVLLSATPYFLAMASDLKYCRYRYSDIFRIYGFNLILLPVNLAGVLKSLEQALTTKKIPFARTPKVKNRTAAAAPYLFAPLFIIAFSLFTVWRNVAAQNWGNAAFAAFNAVTATWATLAYIGIRNLLADVWLGFKNWLYIETRPQTDKSVLDSKPAINWQVILYHGETVSTPSPHSLRNLVINISSNLKGQAA